MTCRDRTASAAGVKARRVSFDDALNLRIVVDMLTTPRPIVLTFDRGTPTYVKPFDVLARESKLEIGSPHWTISAIG